MIITISFAILIFLVSLLYRGENLIAGSFSQQIDLKNMEIIQKFNSFYIFITYLIKNYPIWLLFPAIIIPIIGIKKDNNSIFAILLISINILVMFLSNSHFIRYTLILVIVRILLFSDLISILKEKYKYISGLVLLLLQILINPPPLNELSFKDDTINIISSYLKHNSNRESVLLADYGYFNFHSNISGTSISGYISGGNVRTGEINADVLMKVIEQEKVDFVLIHSEGRLFYPYGVELYYYEPHHIKGIRDFDKFSDYLNNTFEQVKTFRSDKGPVFILFKRLRN